MFDRIKTVVKKNGKVYRYRYREERWRENGKIRSRSRSLGAAIGELLSGRSEQEQAMSAAEKAWAKSDAEQIGKYGETNQARADRQAAGLPAPNDKAAAFETVGFADASQPSLCDGAPSDAGQPGGQSPGDASEGDASP